MKNRILLLVGFVLVISIIYGCGGDQSQSGNDPKLNVNEESVSEDTVAEPIYLNNCGNPASVKQVSQHSQAVTIGGGAELGIKGVAISGSVEGKYSSTKNVTKSITVEAAPNTNMIFVLLWTEKVSEGTVTASGRSGQATYRVSVPISVELSSAKDLGCLTPTPEIPTYTPVPTLTSIPIFDTVTPTITPTFLPEYACDTVNEQPSYGAEFKQGRNFRIQFALVNTGNTTWPDDLELELVSNPYETVHLPISVKKIPRVQPGDTFDIGPFNATAPEELGDYVVSFKLGDGICWPYISFKVVR